MRRVALVLLTLALVASCEVSSAPIVDSTAAASIRIRFAEDFDPGTIDARKEFSLEAVDVPLNLEVIGQDGARLDTFDGWVEFRIDPGEVVAVTTADPDDAIARFGHVKNGVLEDVTLSVRRVFSDARIWVEDVGFDPAGPEDAKCSDGRDNDADGFIDYPQDPGCAYENDDSEEGGSHAAGLSDFIYFADPTLADVQGGSPASPLQGRLVTVDQGTMIVTRLTSDGFYVTDVDDEGEVIPYGSLFVYNYNTPPQLAPCDRIVSLSGSISEFYGFTELNQPSWTSEWWCPAEGCFAPRGQLIGAPMTCPMPNPYVLQATMLGEPEMEGYESALVRVQGAHIPSKFGPESLDDGGSNCDLNNDGNVDIYNGDEAVCNDTCEADYDCTEWNQYLEFGQFIVSLEYDDDGTLRHRVINVVTRDTIVDFEPSDHRGENIANLTGTLRQFSPLGAERGFMLEPRCEDDLVLDGEPVSAAEACVSLRTGGPDDPM